jgi:hypothetical protein
MRTFLWNTFPSTDYISLVVSLRLSYKNVVDFCRPYFRWNMEAPRCVCQMLYYVGCVPLLFDIAWKSCKRKEKWREIRIMRLEPHNTINHFTCACFRYLTLMLTFYVTRLCAHYNLRWEGKHITSYSLKIASTSLLCAPKMVQSLHRYQDAVE